MIQYTAVIDGPAFTGYPAFAGYDSRYPACFPPRLAPNMGWEIGGGRATRQPGQVRKEAALTRSGSGRSSVSYLSLTGEWRHMRFVLVHVPQSQLREMINCGPTDE